jgi:two-component system, chemotaxis family, CheB/CheR fusion protein
MVEGQERDDDGEHRGEELETLLADLRATRGVDLTGYKRSTLRRRIQRRMSAVGLDGDFTRYRDYLRQQPLELNSLLDSVFVNVTSFFRDREAWDHLAVEVIPRIVGQREADAPIRIWSAGCASGEEPFSVAMLLAEHLGLEAFSERVKVYATDWDEMALQQARRARYPRDLETVPEPLRERYFQVDGDSAVLHHAIRRSVIFGQHDLIEDAPISRVALLLCRNTLMYFTAGAQDRVLGRLHFALADDGILFLGRAEMLLSRTGLFVPIDLKHRVFGKYVGDRPRQERRRSPLTSPLRREEDMARGVRLREAALEVSPVGHIVLDPQRRIGVINHRVTVMFPIGPPDLGRPIHDLELSYRPVDLRSMVDEALEHRRTVEKKDVEHRPDGREVQYLDIAVAPLFRDGQTLAIALTFSDVTHHHKLQENLQRSSENLETAYEELQSANEELETTNEELQSANEELETTNEELQAANEEMETVNEELRSTNDELQATNDRLRVQEIEVGQSNAFLNAILSSLRIALTVVGEDGRIRMWNELATELWGLRSDEVVGKRLDELDIGLPVSELVAALDQGARSSGATNRELLLPAINRRGRELMCRVLLTRLTSDEAGIGRGVCVLMEDTSNRSTGGAETR